MNKGSAFSHCSSLYSSTSISLPRVNTVGHMKLLVLCDYHNTLTAAESIYSLSLYILCNSHGLRSFCSAQAVACCELCCCTRFISLLLRSVLRNSQPVACCEPCCCTRFSSLLLITVLRRLVAASLPHWASHRSEVEVLEIHTLVFVWWHSC